MFEGQVFHDVILETIEDGRPWIRLRPIPGGPLDPSLRVEFPKKPRSECPVGTRFRCTVKVAQKHYLTGPRAGTPKGPPYLVADRSSIVRMLD